MRKRVAIWVILFLAGIDLSLSARSAPQDASVHQRKASAVTLLRVINTAEAIHKVKHNRFGSLSELAESGSLDAAGERYGRAWKPLAFDKNAVAERLPGYAMHFTLDGDGQTYSVALTDKSTYDSFFTDERGLIYEAKPIQ